MKNRQINFIISFVVILFTSFTIIIVISTPLYKNQEEMVIIYNGSIWDTENVPLLEIKQNPIEFRLTIDCDGLLLEVKNKSEKLYDYTGAYMTWAYHCAEWMHDSEHLDEIMKKIHSKVVLNKTCYGVCRGEDD